MYLCDNKHITEHLPYIINFFKNDNNISVEKIAKNDIDNRINGYLSITNTTTKNSCRCTIVCDTHDDSGNFFIEDIDYSNMENNNIGWFPQCNCELLIYYFFETKNLYIINLNAFRQFLNNPLHNFRRVKSEHYTEGYLINRNTVEDFFNQNDNDLCLYNISCAYEDKQYHDNLDISKHFIR